MFSRLRQPSDFALCSALALAVLVERAGLSAGALNILTGWTEAIGATLTASSVVPKVSFTGSMRVEAMLAEHCARTLKKLSLALGGNAPFMVFDDADLEAAVEGAMASRAFRPDEPGFHGDPAETQCGREMQPSGVAPLSRCGKRRSSR